MTTELRSQMIALLPRLRAFGRSLTGVADQADDLVQMTVEKALCNLDGFTPGTRLDSWMFRIMRNAWIDTIRARKDTQALDDASAETLVGDDGRTTTEARLHLADVQRAMAGLPEEQRAVLMLVCVEGMRYREVAEALDIPEGTVMSRLSRARLALAGQLNKTPDAAPQKGFAQ
ncbi:MAG: RNA polymerase sigma factor [Pseudotabrizicola sp.]|uniref:RNA polymerase sigma factor n=1 Tax=Pseudotabrizicola sp. TaxID=2939647 RepID=UPI002730817B|nr:RNA polymerase sigma factor [Pseudotabrizicola sp.]MDP2083437.1 RNA polymerase sigma factor [Pseudotabrizicola sp.]MDZ7572822.1 RNA polymerase sigma factor [Pseudotabrizicola sp.]